MTILYDYTDLRDPWRLSRHGFYDYIGYLELVQQGVGGGAFHLLIWTIMIPIAILTVSIIILEPRCINGLDVTRFDSVY